MLQFEEWKINEQDIEMQYSSGLTDEQKEFVEELSSKGLGNCSGWQITSKFEINVEGSVYLGKFPYTYLPIKFNRVSESFIMPKIATTLEGSPRFVGGNFRVVCPQLTTLRGAPKIVEGSIIIDENDTQIPRIELDLLKAHKNLFLKWAQTKMSIEDYIHKYRGHIAGTKFNI